MPEPTTSTATATGPRRSLLKPTLHHIGHMTSNIDAMFAWYAKVVGYEAVATTDNPLPSVYVTNDIIHHRDSFIAAPNIRATERPYVGVAHIAYAYDTISDLLASWQRLKDEEEIEPLVLTCHGTHWSFYYKDPDNNTVELMADCFERREDSLDFIKNTDAYVVNPMGRRVDPERMIAANDGGASLDDLRERSISGDFEPAEFLPPSVLF
jgi:catechol 2,3-dioxygenase-like lactoylglutathione lyase family enzyme